LIQTFVLGQGVKLQRIVVANVREKKHHGFDDVALGCPWKPDRSVYDDMRTSRAPRAEHDPDRDSAAICLRTESPNGLVARRDELLKLKLECVGCQSLGEATHPRLLVAGPSVADVLILDRSIVGPPLDGLVEPPLIGSRP